MNNPKKDVTPDALLERIREYLGQTEDEAERAHRNDTYSGNAPASVDELIKRLKEKGLIESLGTEEYNGKRQRTEYSADEDGEFAESNFFEKADDGKMESVAAIASDDASLEGDVFSSKKDGKDEELSEDKKKGLTVKSGGFESGKKYYFKKLGAELFEESDVSDDSGEIQTEDDFESSYNEDTASYNLMDIFGLEDAPFEDAQSDECELDPWDTGIALSAANKVDEAALRAAEEGLTPTCVSEMSNEEASSEDERGCFLWDDEEEKREELTQEENTLRSDVSVSGNERQLEGGCAPIGEQKEDAQDNLNTGKAGSTEKEPAELATEIGKIKKPERESDATESVSSQSQMKRIAQRIRKLKIKEKKKITCLAVIAAVAFLFEELLVLTTGIISREAVLPVVFLSLFIIAAAVFVVYDEFKAGIKAFWTGKGVKYSVLPALLIPTVFAYFTALASGETRMLFALPFTLVAMLCKASDLVFAAYTAKTVGATVGQTVRYGVCTMTSVQRKPEEKLYAGVVDPGRYFCIRKNDVSATELLNAREDKEESLSLVFSLLVSAFLSLVTFAAELSIGSGSVVSAVWSSMLTAWLTLPLGTVLVNEVIMLALSVKSAKRGSAILSKAALQGGFDGGVITLLDADIYEKDGVRVTDVVVANKVPLEPMLSLAVSVLGEIDKPLSDAIEKMIDRGVTSVSSQIKAVYDDGVEAVSRGVSVFIGSPDFVSTVALADLSVLGDICADKDGLIVVAVDSEVIGAIRVEYAFDKELSRSVEAVSEGGVYVSVRSLDPIITSDYLFERLGKERLPIRVIKCRDNTGMMLSKTDEKSIVVGSSAGAVLYAVSACDRASYTKKMSKVLLRASVAIGFLLSLASVVLGAGLSGMAGFLMVMYHLVWIAPIVLMSAFYIK